MLKEKKNSFLGEKYHVLNHVVVIQIRNSFLGVSIADNSSTSPFFRAMKSRTILESLLLCFTNEMQKFINVQVLTLSLLNAN